MAAINMFLAGFALIFGVFYAVTGEIIKGSVQLNSGVFDKILSKHKAVLVKFDETYPYGEKQDAFREVASSTMSSTDILCGEVQIADGEYVGPYKHIDPIDIDRMGPERWRRTRDYGDKDNMDLAERFNVKKDDYPVYLLFLQGQDEPIKFTGDAKSSDDIKKFLMNKSGLWLGLPNCIEEFDSMVKEFFKADAATRKEILAKAEAEAKNIKDDTKKANADMYVKTMSKILEKGDEFVESEIKRVEKLKEGKVSDKKKEQLNGRLNILHSFTMRQKDEL